LIDQTLASAVEAGGLASASGSTTDPRPPQLTQSALYEQLLSRLGRLHLKQRLGIEFDHESKVFGQGIKFFHLENWYSVHSVIRNTLRMVGLYGRGRRNATDIQIRHNDVVLPSLPQAFDGYTILQISDPHVDMDGHITHALIERVRTVDYDLCVLTGDYRARTFGPFDAVLAGMEQLRFHLKEPIYGVLGNHDTIRMAPGLEAMGIRLLLNEAVGIERGGNVIYLAGIDDAHYYQVDNLEKAANGIPPNAVALLLSHTPEIYRHAAHADFDVMLCGHTHGGQICLPGGFPITWDASCPRQLAAGAWRYHNMIGYTSAGAGTSIVDVRFNCRAEITLHHLRAGGAQ
jgi:predicted MPP superfamily phosphohydrolase